MRVETKRLGFKKLTIFLEDNFPDFLELKKKYSSITIVSHTQRNLPECRVKEKDTALIDLALTKDDIFKRFSDTTRNEIRKTLDDESFVIQKGKIVAETYELYSAFEKAQGRKPVSQKEMEIFSGGYVSYKGNILYGMYSIESFPYVRIRSIFSKRLVSDDTEMIKKISNAGRRLFWEMFLDAQQRGFVSYDLASVNQHNPRTINIAKFKMSFGGDIRKEYTYMYSSKIFGFFEKLYSKLLG